MKKKIAFIAFDLNPFMGSECSTAHIWLEQISHFYKVDVYVDIKHKSDIQIYKYNDNISFIYIDANSAMGQIAKKLRLYNIAYHEFIKRLKSELKIKMLERDYGLVHCITPAGIHSYNDLYKFGIPVVIGPLGGGLQIPDGFRYILGFREKIINFFRDQFYYNIKKSVAWQNYFLNSECIIVGTPYVRNMLPKKCWKKSKVIFDTLIDTSIFYRDSLFPSNPSKIVITFVGRLESVKGVDLLIEAFLGLKNNCELNIVGDGFLKLKLEQKVKKFKMENSVKFWGNVPRTQVIDILNRTDIFCLPTLREPGGVAIIEAMSCGLPVVTTDYGGPAYSVSSNCGIRIKPLNRNKYITDLFDSLNHLAENSYKRRLMGDNARERAIHQFSADAARFKIVEIYNSILEK